MQTVSAEPRDVRTTTRQSVLSVDQAYSKICERRAANAAGADGVPPYNLVGEESPDDFDHAFAGILVYVIEPGVFLLQQRDHLAPWNPDKISIFGGQIRPGESPSAAAVRELAQETGVVVRAAQLVPFRFYVERRTRVPVLRAIYVLTLDRLPRHRRPGEGAGILEVRAMSVEHLEQITPLSHEDVTLFLDHWYPHRSDFSEE